MKYDIPDDHEELKKFCKKIMEELSLTKSELNRQKEDNKFYKAAMDYIPNAIFIKDEMGRFVFFNKEYERIFGMTKFKYLGRTALDLDYLDEDSRIKYHDEDMGLIATGEVIHYDQDFLFSDDETHPCFYWSRGFLVEETGERGLIGEVVDITKERALEMQLSASLEELEIAKNEIERASMIDPGTGLFNRYVFDSQTRELINDSRVNGTPLSVMMADLDHFKRVNDTFGHLEGDRVLKDFATLLKSEIRSVDVPIRYGGEEFLVFLPGTDLPKARMVAERVRQVTHDKMRLPDDSKITVSVGVVKFKGEETRTQCIQRCDEALYTAKSTGRNKVVVFADESETYMG